ncbi:MAG: MBL fold metallo-hydrolase [Candidatus Eremiobacteraeota bacterium]|nr:MBL fold metallo-hydrolase [Candidatus Eremiobacteraeota bacterium]
MKVKVLGSAAGGGLPQWNCACRNCRAARAGLLPSRSVAAIAVSANDGRWVLVNASCDIGRQVASAPDLAPHDGRKSPVAALLLTDANIDHTAGLLELRQAESCFTYSTRLVQDTLCSAPMFAPFARADKRWRSFVAHDDPVRIDVAEAPNLRIAALAVPGLLPSYAGGSRKAGATVAYLFEHGDARLVYAPIFLALEGPLRKELDHAEAVFLDGTCWTDDEMVELGLGARTARAMGHQPIWGEGGSLHASQHLSARHRYYTHVNNSNPILDPSSEQAETLRHSGFAVADDGLEISLDGNQSKA